MEKIISSSFEIIDKIYSTEMNSKIELNKETSNNNYYKKYQYKLPKNYIENEN